MKLESEATKGACAISPPSLSTSSQRHSFAYLFERFPSFVQTFVYREASEMVRQGMAPLLVSVRHPDDSDDVAAKLGLDVFYLPEEKLLRGEVDAWRAARQLSWQAHRAIPQHRHEADAQRMFEAIWLEPVLRERGVTHVHAHFGGLAARTAWWLRRLFGFTYSFTGHANDIFCATEFPVSNAELAREARLIVTETDYARRWMEEHHRFTRGKVFRVFNGIDFEGFLPRQEPGKIPRILSVGRYVEKKGFDVLIDACALLRERGIVFRCEIIGGGPLEAALSAQRTSLALEEQVQLLGPRSQKEIREELAAAQLFVLACQPDREGGSDNLPTVIAEAMIAGVPVISTPLAGIPEMIADGVEGLLVPIRDPRKLADAIAELLENPARAQQLAARAQETAFAKFAVENTTRELKQLLVRHARVQPTAAARELDPTLPRARWSLLKWW